MQPLGTEVYILKMYSPSDSLCTFFSAECLPEHAYRNKSIYILFLFFLTKKHHDVKRFKILHSSQSP